MPIHISALNPHRRQDNIIENIVPPNVGRNLGDMARYENEVKRRTRAGERVY
jgi:hypothetical protein